MSISKKRLRELASRDEAAIDYSDIPELDDDFWKDARLAPPEGKKQLTVRFDADVIEWLKGKGYQSRMNAVLRSYIWNPTAADPHPVTRLSPGRQPGVMDLS